eukprot:m.492154 g.492154  ORF g.492154 m.492154 type:complete len:202 (+) comp31711_c0_seq1:293-898(+)
MCAVCDDEQPAKYRCPKCLIRYCSLKCFKQHKTDPATGEPRHCKQQKQEHEQGHGQDQDQGNTQQQEQLPPFGVTTSAGDGNPASSAATESTVAVTTQHRPLSSASLLYDNGVDDDEENQELDNETTDRVPRDTLRGLRGNRNVCMALTNPHLRDMLARIDASSRPVAELRAAMKIPIFIEFADACLDHCGAGRQEGQGQT